MVKNVTGGNKSKRGARKSASGNTDNSELRYVQEEGEVYAVVKKMLGNGICEVVCQDGKTRQCVIRSKFRGRGKSSNIVEVGKWVMVGIRDWEVRSDNKKLEKSDLLHIYSDTEKHKLANKPDLNLNALKMALRDGESGSNTNAIMEEDISFSTSAEIAYDKIQSNPSLKNDVVLISTNIINFDDI